ncbi:bifunctional diaminohydroxyphosphoribosylaminopyrimidine deaminase/5-amino-6-(5-phosphoribosylamino)uracil reductase RibD [Fictibacillus sp. Mic-4]
MRDETFMELALKLAESAKGQTSPNPLVGAIVVKDGQVVGMGAHLKAGEPHAEVHALTMAGDKAKGATIYVTLEPCSHFGKTPPCADLVIERGIKRAVIATTDPNPLVSGKGIQRLKEAGIQVDFGLMKDRADELNAVFYHFIKTKKPFVTLKTATSLDGKTATSTGESQWITSEAARLDVHRYRHEHDAILVGIGTVLKDNPSLTTRLPNGGKNPIRIILDTHLLTPIDSNMICDGKAPTWIVTGNEVKPEAKHPYEEKGITILSMNKKTIDISDVLKMLGKRGITSIFVEGGATVNGSFLQSGEVDQVITYVAPLLIGGQNAPTSFSGEGFRELEKALHLKIKSVEQIGPDIKIISVPERE